MANGFRSYAEQSGHYFDRPHEGIPAGPLAVPAAWRGAAARHDERWRVRLSSDQVRDLDGALARAQAMGHGPGRLRAEDFPMPFLESELDAWKSELSVGRGFLVLSGVPVDRWGEEGAALFFWALGLHLGQPGAQNPAGDLLGHVEDTREAADNPLVRLYRTSSEIAYHCDAADVVGLLCLRSATRGGASRIASSVTVWNELKERRPDLAARLFEPIALDLRTEETRGMAGWVPIVPCRYGGGQLRTFYHSDYFRSAPRHGDAPRLEGVVLEALDLFEEIAHSPDICLDMDLAPGDVQLLSNHTIVHARTAYEDTGSDHRHLLRLWLSL